MKRRTAVLAALTLTAASLTGCTGKAEQSKSQETKSQGPQTTTIEISYDELLNQKQISRSVTLALGDYLQVSLGSNASTGYEWEDKMLISDPKVITQTGHENIAPAADKPGAPGSEVWMLQTMERGQTTVSTTYGRPWPGGEKDTWVFTVNVTVN